MPVALQQLWVALEYPRAFGIHLVGVLTSPGLHRRTEVDIRGSVAMPSDVVLTAGSSSSLGIGFSCCVRFVSSASQAVALRQISSSVAIGSWTFAHDRIWPPAVVAMVTHTF